MLAFCALGIPSSSLPVAHYAAEKPSTNFLSAPRLRSSAGLGPHTVGHRSLFAVPSDAVVSTQQILAASDNSLFRHAAVSRDEALVLYEDMVLGRVFEDTCAQMYYLFGFVHLYYNGQEAFSTGFIKLLEAWDSVVSKSMIASTVHAISKGVPPRAVMAELFGKATGHVFC